MSEPTGEAPKIYGYGQDIASGFDPEQWERTSVFPSTDEVSMHVPYPYHLPFRLGLAGELGTADVERGIPSSMTVDEYVTKVYRALGSSTELDISFHEAYSQANQSDTQAE